MRKVAASVLSLLIFLTGSVVNGQISPGKLAAVHAHLEGISNCTKCHELGDKVTDAKCLGCHTEVKSRIDQKKGYHFSSEVRGKNCFSCHNDHHGLTFQILKFDKTKFNHDLSGFKLTGIHVKKECKDCHKTDRIADSKIKNKKFTYLGLSNTCLSCHTDYHQKTLAATCTDCHGFDAFKPAPKFNHTTSTKFPLTGMHQPVPCIKCHALTTKNGTAFQEFAGIKFQSCSNCHADPHQNKFGQNCSQCHATESFHTVKGISNFDHSKTSFKLEDKHQFVTCQKCHKASITAPVKHDRCLDCHKDFHNKQFVKEGVVQDCADCHSTRGFTSFSYTVEQHNNGNFKLEGAHLATPCFSCHKKQEQWSFKSIGLRCVDCHKDIHEPYIKKEIYPDSTCQTCHNPSRWSDVTYDHSKTDFALTGAHTKPTCRNCHFKKEPDGKEHQQFSSLTKACTQCHADIHFNQFENNGEVNCLRCHSTNLWKISNFDHNTTAFKLDGKHQHVACAKCHKPATIEHNTYVLYKIKGTRCENCH
ncbi:MAG: cytochrome C [Bacteroidota bacterium]